MRLVQLLECCLLVQQCMAVANVSHPSHAKGIGSYWSSWFEHVRESPDFVRYLGFDPANGGYHFLV